MRRLAWVVGVAALTACTITPMAAWSQTGGGVDLLTPETFSAKTAQQLAAAKKAETGSVLEILHKYPGSYSMITTRVKSGGAEVHARYSDFLIVLDGEGTELTGGKVIDGKQLPDGETRGLRLDGGTPHPLHKGSVIHIPAGTPHQAVEAPGQTLTLLVIKVEKLAGATITTAK